MIFNIKLTPYTRQSPSPKAEQVVYKLIYFSLSPYLDKVMLSHPFVCLESDTELVLGDGELVIADAVESVGW